MENIQHDYFIWEEKNLTDQNQNSLKNEKSVKESSIIETKNDLTQKDWKDITDPKERKKAYNNAWYKDNKDKIPNERQKAYQKAWCKDNIDKIRLQKKAYRENNKDKIKLQKKAYDEVNKEKQKIYIKKYREQNKSIIKEKKRIRFQKEKEKVNEHYKIRYNQDVNFKLKCRLRHRLRMALKGNFKSGSAVDELGCTTEELKSYLESKFQPGMSWDNWTSDGWHIDHIKPLNSFDLTDKNQLLEACHYTNLQPLWATDNITKSDKIF
jgi:hypothetical protein